VECFYYKGRVLIISAIKAINSDRPQELCMRASTRCVKTRAAFKRGSLLKGVETGIFSFRGEKFYFSDIFPGSHVELAPFLFAD